MIIDILNIIIDTLNMIIDILNIIIDVLNMIIDILGIIIFDFVRLLHVTVIKAAKDVFSWAIYGFPK